MAEWWEAAPVAPPEAKSGGDDWWHAAPTVSSQEAKKPSTFGERLQKVWDNPTPGGAVWLAKQAVQGVTGAVDASKAATETPQTLTEEGAFQQRQAREALPAFAAQAASVMSPGAPKGTGGLLAAPMATRAAPEVVRNLPAVAGGAGTALTEPVTESGLAPVVAAAKRLSDFTGTDVEIPRAIATDSTTAQRIGQGLRNVPIVGDRIPQATDRLVENLGEATRNVAERHGMGSGPNVANRIGQGITRAAEDETRQATEAATRSDEAVRAAWQRDTDAAIHNIVTREQQGLEAARAAVGDMSPQDMGAALISRLRTDERTARTAKDRLYDVAGRADASVRMDEVQNARPFIVQGLEEQGVVIDPLLTPAANRMLDEVQRIAQANIPNRAQLARPAAPGDELVGVTVQGIEQARKRLVSLRSAANNDADRRAARLVMDRFDDWQSHAFENALLSGDDRALRAFREARAANTSWRNRFFNTDDDAGQLVNRIVTGEVTPQEVANYIVGAGQIGAKGVSSRLLTRIAEATENNPEAMQVLRGGIWNKLSQSTEGLDPKAAAKVTRDIIEFLNGPGRDVAERLFTPDQRRIMRAYADTLRSGQDARQLVGQVAENTRPGTTPVPSGPLKQLADAVVGKGSKSDEALFRTIDGYARSGNRSDVATLAKLVSVLPQEERNDLAGAIIRNIGISPRTGQFSPDVFVSQWKTYSPQAKAVLFGNAGSQRQAIDDIMLISDRLKQVGSKFGNPSGTAQNANLFGLGAAATTAGAALMHGDVLTPLSMLATGMGGYAAARFLAAPAGASSAAKWAKAYSALIMQRSPQAVALFKVASRNMANTARDMGIKMNPNDLMRALQGPTPAGADDEQKQPVRVRQ